jgi:hypothetical protein
MLVVAGLNMLFAGKRAQLVLAPSALVAQLARFAAECEYFRVTTG